jgi:hypothetical protein
MLSLLIKSPARGDFTMAEIKNMLSLLIKSPARGELNYG